MNILVSGGSGFIGSHVVDKLTEAGHSVSVFDLKKPQRKDIKFLEGNISSRKDIAGSLHDIEAVYHIAAFSNIDLVKSNPLVTIESNIMGTAYLLEESRRQKVKRFILASSIYVYDEKGHLYTTCKIASELLCKNYYTLYSLRYTILRYATAYGPRSRMADVISLFVKNALSGDKLTVRGSGEQKRHFIYVEDLARGNVAALNPLAENRTYTLAGKEPTTIKYLAEKVKSILNSSSAIAYDASREDDYLGKIPESHDALQDLGWEPEISLEEGIRRYIQWYKETSKGI